LVGGVRGHRKVGLNIHRILRIDGEVSRLK
jgi:hypothetical protein